MIDVPETQHEQPLINAGRGSRRVIHATCMTHGGGTGFTNLVATKRGGVVELDSHATGSCVIVLDEDGARALHEALGEWIG